MAALQADLRNGDADWGLGVRMRLCAGMIPLVLFTLAACDSSPTAPSDLEGGVLATFDVSGERFRAFVTNPHTIDELFRVRAGTSNATIPNGRVRRGPGAANHNAPYSWHLDPVEIQMAEVTIEVCDGRPTFVENNLDDFVERIERYCPWNARLLNLRDFR